MKEKRRDRMKEKRREMKENMILLKNVLRTTQICQMNQPKMFRKKKKPSDELFLHFSAKVQNLAVFSLIYMIRIRFFGRGIKSELLSGCTVIGFSKYEDSIKSGGLVQGGFAMSKAWKAVHCSLVSATGSESRPKVLLQG